MGEEFGAMDWKPADTAPWQRVVWVRNRLMDRPCKATRGYVYNNQVHPDKSFFTTVYTEDEFFPIPSGRLCVPEEWAPVNDGEG